MIASGERPPGCVSPWAGFAGMLASRGSVRESGEVVSHPPIRPPAGAGAMTMYSGDRAAQSVLRARQGRRLRIIVELARGHAAPLRGCHRAAVGSVAGGGAAACPALASRCQARVSSLRATAVVAIFFPRRVAMRWKLAANCGVSAGPDRPRTAPLAPAGPRRSAGRGSGCWSPHAPRSLAAAAMGWARHQDRATAAVACTGPTPRPRSPWPATAVTVPPGPATGRPGSRDHPARTAHKNCCRCAATRSLRDN
jgi:hypothetical protein